MKLISNRRRPTSYVDLLIPALLLAASLASAAAPPSDHRRKNGPPRIRSNVYQDRVVNIPQPSAPIWNPNDTPALAEKDVRWAKVVDATAVAGASGNPLAGGIAPGGACSCDEDCAVPANQCEVANCRKKCSVTIVYDCNVDTDCPLGETCLSATCVVSNAPVNTRCNQDALFCTDDRCGVNATYGFIECQPTNTSATSAVRLNRCAKECNLSKKNCDTFFDCTTLEECVLKVTNPSNYQAVCNEAADQCEVKIAGVGSPIGRCCTSPALFDNCAWTTQAACTGLWLRLRDPDDTLHGCGTGTGCPKYSSGIAPADAIGPANLDLGDVVPSPRRCQIHGNICEVDADCFPVCVGGASTVAGQSCDRDSDCPGACSVTTATLCTSNAQCPGVETCTNPVPGTCPPRAAGSCVNVFDDCSGAGVFAALGDDYELANHGPGQFLHLQYLRFRGGVDNTNEVIVFDFYDQSTPPVRVNSFAVTLANRGIFDYTIQIDCDPDCDLTQCPGLTCEEPLEAPLIIPSAGYVVMRSGRGISTQFGENDSTASWITTDMEDVGTNDPNRMVVKLTSPSTSPLNFNANLTGHPVANNVLMFEFLGEKVPPPLGACCNRNNGTCTDTLQWNCRKCTATGATCDQDRDCSLSQANDCTTRDWHGPRTRDDYLLGVGELCAGGQCSACACCTDAGCVTVGNQAACDALPPAGPNPPIQCGVGSRRCTLSPGTPCEIADQCSGLGMCALSACTPNCCPQPLSGYDCCRTEFRCTPQTGVVCQQNSDCPSGSTCNVASPVCTGAQSACIPPSLPAFLGDICFSNADCGAGGVCGPRDASKVHVITVPPLADPRPSVVVAISGSIPATGITDDCTLGEDDFGWRELFTIDQCAEVTIDLCCNQNPIRQPVIRSVENRCPCSISKTIFPDVDSSGGKDGFGDNCNHEFCCDDGNWSGQFTLAAGRYQYRLSMGKNCSNSGTGCDNDTNCDPGAVCQRNPSTYQMHITVRPCFIAACCVQDTCSVTNLIDCWQMGGEFPEGCSLCDHPIPDCTGNPCALGACCMSAFGCADNNRLGISPNDCLASGGLYHGGRRCSFLGCPICPFEDPAHCQLAETGQFSHRIDRRFNQRVADDFRPSGNSIGRVCWFPCFRGSEWTLSECSGNPEGTPPPDAFIIRFYEDDQVQGAGGMSQGFPGVPVASQPSNPLGTGGFGYAVNVDFKLPKDGGKGTTRCWRYSAPITPALSVVPGECYWMEISGKGNEQGGGLCVVEAMDSGDGNNMRAVDTNGVYELSDIDRYDMAWCIDSGIIGASDPPQSQDGGCGDLPVACCRPGTCFQTTYIDCVGGFTQPKFGQPFPYQTCSAGICPIPANDLCADATNLSLSSPDHNCDGPVSDPDLGKCVNNPPSGTSLNEVCSVSAQDCEFCPTHNCCVARTPGTDAYRCLVTNVDNRLATCECPPNVPTGGTPNQQNTACNSGANAFQRDVWYQYTAPCTGRLTVFECGLPGFDAMLMVYSNDTPSCTCSLSNAAVPPAGFANDRACNDDFCSTSAETSAVALPVIKDGCYLIRAGGYSQAGGDSDAGFGITQMDIGVICDLPSMASPALAVTSGQLACRKNRYISFQTNNLGRNVAFRINRLAGASGPTMQGWAGPPDANGVSGVYDTPHFSSTWPAIIHVGDCEIIPVVNYEVRAMDSNNILSPPLALQTSQLPTGGKFWGDVVGQLIDGAWQCPDGVTNINDVQSALQAFLGLSSAPHLTLANVQAVSSTDPCLNNTVNIADVFLILKAFQGNVYPFVAGTTANCPPNNGGANCPP